MTREILLNRLPPFENKKQLIKVEQSVNDIVREVLDAHVAFSSHYDYIAGAFNYTDPVMTLEKLFEFLKQNVRYKEESELKQLTKSPSAILETGVCDCKCYSLFIAGVLDALNRHGANFDWQFAFAGYKSNKIRHVFVRVVVHNTEYWVDPVLGSFDQRAPKPSFIKLKKPMALHRLSGVGYVSEDGGPLTVTAEAVRVACLSPMESVDEQLMRLSDCPQEKTYMQDVPIQDSKPLYDAAITTAVKTSRTVDTILDSPGVPAVKQAPTGVAPTQAYTLTDGKPDGAADDNTVEKTWLQKNGVLVAAAGLALLLFMSKRKRR